MKLPTEVAVPVALIANELVTNALKDAQTPDGRHTIEVASRDFPKRS